ncbi:hypothetical protein BBP40_009492 [Aspergillus hancockii]|nr:hypothetical protein BBP40_009492 [Aspergillus hancockii]
MRSTDFTQGCVSAWWANELMARATIAAVSLHRASLYLAQGFKLQSKEWEIEHLRQRALVLTALREALDRGGPHITDTIIAVEPVLDNRAQYAILTFEPKSIMDH